MGVAVFVNAFNFPAWGFAEKAACALLAGMPVITKPATATALVAHRIFERIAEKQALPEATFQLLLGPVGDLFDHLDGQDVLAFTGSSGTGAKLKGDPRLVARNVDPGHGRRIHPGGTVDRGGRGRPESLREVRHDGARGRLASPRAPRVRGD